MIQVHKMAAQGDCLFLRVAKIPEGFTAEAKNGSIVVAHSETGHHHSVDATDGVTLFVSPSDPLVCYLQMEGVDHADVVHHRPWDTHETLRLLGAPKKTTIFAVRRQREYTPEGWRRVED
jgi:hypothetical protein